MGWISELCYVKLDLSLLCFSVYTTDTESTKPTHELEFLRTQLSTERASSAACIGGYTATWRRLWPPAKHKTAGTWINNVLFAQVSKQIAAEGNWMKNDWIVRVDANVVSFPYRSCAIQRSIRSWMIPSTCNTT